MREDTARSGVNTDTGPITVVPEWLLDADVSDRAVRLYAVLGRYADQQLRSWPSRRKLAGRLRCSVDTLDRAVRELTDAEALNVIPRYDEAGDRTSNLYVLRRVRPGVRTDAQTGDRMDAATGGGTDAAVNEGHDEEGPSEVTDRGTGLARIAAGGLPGPRTVDRKAVTEDEREFAWSVLGAWNQAADQTLRSHDWLSKIIRRQREFPEATLADHTLIIETALAHPWWSGPATPSVVYGNGAQFERSIQQVRQRDRDGDDRLRRIVEAGVAAGRRTA